MRTQNEVLIHNKMEDEMKTEQVTVNLTLSVGRMAVLREYAARYGLTLDQVASDLLEAGSRKELAGWSDALLASMAR